MSGVALFEGTFREGHNEYRHASLTVIDHAGPAYFDYRCGRFFSYPEDVADFDHGLYWDVPHARVQALKVLLANMAQWPRTDLIFSRKSPPAGQPCEVFNLMVQGEPAPEKFQVNCVTAATRSLAYAGIACPFMDTEIINGLEPLVKAVQGLVPMAEDWQTIPGGHIWHCPNMVADHRRVTGKLLPRLSGAAPEKLVATL